MYATVHAHVRHVAISSGMITRCVLGIYNNYGRRAHLAFALDGRGGEAGALVQHSLKLLGDRELRLKFIFNLIFYNVNTL